jgi:hypothetical protein
MTFIPESPGRFTRSALPLTCVGTANARQVTSAHSPAGVATMRLLCE